MTILKTILKTNNKISGNVYDLEFNDKYDQFRVKDVIGEFVNNVKEKYKYHFDMYFGMHDWMR